MILFSIIVAFIIGDQEMSKVINTYENETFKNRKKRRKTIRKFLKI